MMNSTIVEQILRYLVIPELQGFDPKSSGYLQSVPARRSRFTR